MATTTTSAEHFAVELDDIETLKAASVAPSQTPQALRKLTSERTRRAPISRGTVPANGALTIYTGTGAGVVTNIWMTLSTYDVVKDCHLQVFVDGETIPSVDVDLGSLFLGHLNAPIVKFLWSTAHMHGEGGQNSSIGGAINLPIPYSNGCVIKLVNSTTVGLYTFTQVDATPGVDLPYRMRSRCIPYALNHTLAATDVERMFSTPTGSPGWLAWLGYVAAGTTTTNESFLERNMELTIDGESTPSIVPTGGEDFFLGSFYFQGRASYDTPDLALSYHSSSPAQTLVGMDILQRWGGFRFESSMACDLTTKPQCTGGHSYGFVALFYTPKDSAWGQPFNTPAAPTAPWIRSTSSGDSQVSLVVAPSTNARGSAVTGMTVTATPVGGGTAITKSIGATATSTTVTGLTNGTSYAFSVTATNAIGTSPASPTLTAAPFAAASAVGAIAPTSISGLLGWWKADAITGVADGGTVSSWSDSSGVSGLAFAQANAQFQPLYKANVLNGKPVIRFDGLDDVLTLPSVLASTAGAYTMLVVGKINQGVTTGVRFVNSGTGAPTLFLLSTNASSNLIINAGSSDAGNVALPAGYNLLSGISGASGNAWVNGSIGTTANAGTSPPAQLQIGQRPAGAYFGLDLCEIVVFTGAISTSDRQGLEQYLANKYALPQPAKS